MDLRATEHHCRHCCPQSACADQCYPVARVARHDEGSCFVSYQHKDVSPIIVIDTGQFIFRICRDCLARVAEQISGVSIPRRRMPTRKTTRRKK